MKNLLPIGRFSQLARLTIKALRLYDELGLLRPAYVDPDTGYRYYSLAQAKEAEQISLLRTLEMPLEQIRELVSTRDPVRVRELLDRHRQRIEERLAEHERALAFLRRLTQTEVDMSHEIVIRQVQAQPVVSIRQHTSLARLGELFGRAMGEMFDYVARVGARPVGPPFSIYHDPEFKEEDLDVEIGIPTEKHLAGNGRIVGSELPAGPLACTLHAGPYQEIGPAYQALFAWIRDHGHETSGPPREVYLVGPGQAPSPAEYRTEIGWPLRAGDD